jgi:hypothetical protein
MPQLKSAAELIKTVINDYKKQIDYKNWPGPYKFGAYFE